MNLNYLTSGEDVPENVNALIEISARSMPVKYEMDKKAQVLVVSRILSSGMSYPFDYGFIPHTLGEDGDPLDIMVVAPYPLLPGVLVSVRPLGLLEMSDESGRDIKILAVPVTRITPIYQNIKKAESLGKDRLDIFALFFQNYQNLDPGKNPAVGEWKSAKFAKNEIMASIKRYSEKLKSNHV